MKLKIYLFSLLIIAISIAQAGCKAKTCPAYGDDDPPTKRSIFKKHKKPKNGLFTKKQRRY
ncbi:MAG: hypothetical protein HUU47_11095 [Bacteroidetes bacterium]|nr:hypothetical protein [Bacteroidota bacterium]